MTFETEIYKKTQILTSSASNCRYSPPKSNSKAPPPRPVRVPSVALPTQHKKILNKPRECYAQNPAFV
jgi:hypothetical protein